MASGIHTLSPSSNINFINSSLSYTLSSNEIRLHDQVNYDENQEFSRNVVSPNNFEYVDPNRSNIKLTKMVFNLTPPPNRKVVNYNNNIEQRGRFTMRYSTNSSKGYDSDEDYISHKETTDNNGTKFKRFSKEKVGGNEKSEFQNQSGLFQPNLYQPRPCPSGNCNRSRRYFSPRNRNKYLNNVELAERNVYGLMKRFKARVHKMKINPNPQDLLNGGPWDQLNQSIWDVFIAKVEKEETYMKKLNLWQSIFLFSRTCLDNYALYLVGSTMTGFALESSDIDMCLLTKRHINEPRIDALRHLDNLKEVLLNNGLASEAELIMAKVPILKFKNEDTGFEVDLSCNNTVGVHNTRLLYNYAQLDWRVRPLVVIVKIWAQSNNINDAKTMTISSYSWALMVIHYLQCGVSPPVLPCLHQLYPEKFNSNNETNIRLDGQEEFDSLSSFESVNTRCLGDLLIGFFHYYSYFAYTEYAISVRTGSLVPVEVCKQTRSPKNDPHQWKFLCIEEPFNFSNTARSVFNFEIFRHIKRVMLSSYKELACNKDLSRILPLTQLSRQS